MKEHISGWLFFNLERTRLIFIADGLEVEESFDWNVLLEQKRLDEFVRRFRATPTTEGPLKGYRVDARKDRVVEFLGNRKPQGAGESV